jgi:hypothetical protein
METKTKGTVTISTEEYNKLMDFKKENEFKKGKILVVRDKGYFQSGSFSTERYYLPENEVFDKLKEEIEFLREEYKKQSKESIELIKINSGLKAENRILRYLVDSFLIPQPEPEEKYCWLCKRKKK